MANAVPRLSRLPSGSKHQKLISTFARGECIIPRRESALAAGAFLPYDRWRVFAPLPFSRRGRLSYFVSPVCLLAFLLCSPSVDRFFPYASFGAPSLSFFALLLDLFSSSVSFFFRLVRSPAIVGVSVVEKMLLRPLPRVRASCARASGVSNNCLHLFTQCAQPLDMECFVVKANCRVFRFAFLPDGCKALSFSEIR